MKKYLVIVMLVFGLAFPGFSSVYAGDLEEKSALGSLSENITLSGVIEVEAGYAKNGEDASDIVVATVEVGIDAQIVKHVSGHILFLYEEDDTPFDVDEAIISINGEDVVPLYLNAGQMYLPFGNFESHMISDPVTLELGETRESAVVAGFATDWIDICAGVFNGDIDETGEDNEIKSYVAGAVFTLPENTVDGFALTAGASYISNIGDSDSLQDAIIKEVPDSDQTIETINDYVPGYSAFVSISVLDRFFFNAEYLTAADEFEFTAHELAGADLPFDGQKFKPSTWYAEVAVGIIEDLEIAVHYAGSDDCDDLPENRYGAAITYGLFESTSLGLEYLHDEFENDDETDIITAQLAIEF